jgi:septal ring factor EnvC (AmiA/AmiB activator)
MLMENCDFKTAFHQLGGEYSGRGLSDAAVLRIKRMQLDKQKKERKLQQAQDEYSKVRNEMIRIKEEIKELEPMSDEWCSAQNRLVMLEADTDSALNKLLDLQKQEKR